MHCKQVKKTSATTKDFVSFEVPRQKLEVFIFLRIFSPFQNVNLLLHCDPLCTLLIFIRYGTVKCARIKTMRYRAGSVGIHMILLSVYTVQQGTTFLKNFLSKAFEGCKILLQKLSRRFWVNNVHKTRDSDNQYSVHTV